MDENQTKIDYCHRIYADLISRGYFFPVVTPDVGVTLESNLGDEQTLESVLTSDLQQIELEVYLDDFDFCSPEEQELVQKICLATNKSSVLKPQKIDVGSILTDKKHCRKLVFLGRLQPNLELGGVIYSHAEVVRIANAVILFHPSSMIKNPNLKISAWKSIQALS